MLGQNYTNPAPATLGLGQYAIRVLPGASPSFLGWSTTGNVTVTDPDATTTTLVVGGSGSVFADAGSGQSNVAVQFAGVGASAALVVGVGAPGSSGGLPGTVQNNSTVALSPGTYALQVVPAPGYVLTRWHVGGSASLTDMDSAATWLNVLARGSAASVWADLAPASGGVGLVVRASGNGTVTVNGTAVPYHANNDTSFANLSEKAGGYPVVATPAPGWSFLGWRTAPGAVVVAAGLSPAINVTIANGTGYLFATFGAQIGLDDSPASAGSISVNSTGGQDNGTAVVYARGTYSLAAVPAGGEAFQHWQVSDPKALEVLRPGFSLTKLVVNSSATLTAVYAAQTTENVTFVISSAPGGYVQFNFQNLTANSTLNSSVVNTTYELKAFAASAYRFNGFTTTGPVTVTSGELSVTGGGGVVTAHFALRLYPVTFVATRPGAVTMTLNGFAVTSGSTYFLARGSYNVTASVVGADATFVQWSSLLDVSNVSASGANASIRVDAPGTVMGIVATFALGRLAVSPSLADVESPLQFQVFANGTGALAYRYLGLPAGCSSASTPQLLCLPDTAGTYSVRVAVSDAGGAVATSAPVGVTVVAAPAVASFLASPAATDLHVAVTFHVVPSAGTGPYSFVYSNLPVGCHSASVANLSCTPQSSGTYLVGVAVTDAFGLVAYGNTTLTVATDPKVVSATWAPADVDTGIPAVLTTSTTGGTGALTYSYAGLPSDCASVDSATVTCTSSLVGVSNVTVTISDALGLSAIAKNVLVVRERPHGAVLAFSPASLTLGEATSVSAAVAAGTPPIAFSYLGLPTGCRTENLTGFFCTPTANGTFQVEFVATDAFGISASANATLTVTSPTPPSPGPTPSTTHGIDWKYVGLIALVAIAVAAVLVWRFGRPPSPADPKGPAEPAETPATPPEDPAYLEGPGEPPR